MDFYVKRDGGIGYAGSQPEHDRELGIWLSFDLGRNYYGCLNALMSIADVESLEKNAEHFEGEGYDVEFAPDKVTVSNRFLEERFTSYVFAEAKAAIESFWRFIITVPDSAQAIRVYRPDLPEHLADLVLWEEQWRRPHPYRGRIEGIPTKGPA
ncbi:hypothetical protein [Nonomuraea helvata]|uniref:Uncharacterized protein n=1 Tax=Nonomuraea helvata TaxID=37484 RepID=A0ABV5SIU6_9ACTN